VPNLAIVFSGRAFVRRFWLYFFVPPKFQSLISHVETNFGGQGRMSHPTIVLP
jgi:hypothetical protein